MSILKLKDKLNIVWLLFIGETFSNIGSNLFTIAINWYLYKITTNSLIIGIISGIFNCTALLNIITGTFADKNSRLNIMICTDSIQIVITFLAFIIYHKNIYVYCFIIFIEFVSQILSAFFYQQKTHYCLYYQKELMKI